jgi:hypothetical protein
MSISSSSIRASTESWEGVNSSAFRPAARFVAKQPHSEVDVKDRASEKRAASVEESVPMGTIGVSAEAVSMRHGLAVIALLTLSGCTSALFQVPSHLPAAYETVETFYRPLAANAAKEFVGNSPVQIAELRPSIAPQPGDWMTCVRSWKDGQQVYIAVFFRDREAYETRIAKVIDRCGEGPYPVATFQQVRR